MRSRQFRACLALLLGLTLVGASLAPRLPGPLPQPVREALAVDTAVATCDEESFDATLSAVQASGGGAITFACTGTIVFSGGKTITTNVTIVGNGGVVFDGNDSTRLFTVNEGAQLDLVALTLQNGRSDGGGAIYNNFGAMLTINASTFSSNDAEDTGSGGSFGGAIANSGGTTTITASTFSGNSAGFGGAISSSGNLTITASTFNGNSADFGGATAIFAPGATAITASTFSDNSAVTGGAILTGFNVGPVPTLTIQTSILANSLIGDNCAELALSILNSAGSNLSDDTSCGFTASGDIQDSSSVNLGPLAGNGGLTQTMLPAVNSAAIDAAACSLSSAQDQRGATRPTTGTDCDIGAVEVQGTIPAQILAVHYAGPAFELQPVEIAVLAIGPPGANLTYEFDCGNDGAYEINQINDPSASCTFSDIGFHVVAMRVNDGSTSATDQTTVEVLAAAPGISSLVLTPSPSDEGEEVNLTAGFENIHPTATHTCEIDWGDATVENGTVTETDGSGTCQGSHSYAVGGNFTVTVTVCDSDACSDRSTIHTVKPDGIVSTCDWPTFTAMLDVVQLTGGGTITFDCTGTITFSGFKTISTDVTIIGNGGVFFDGAGSTWLFEVDAAARLALTAMTLQNGLNPNTGGKGGAIASAGTLTITDSTFSGNNASFHAGAIHNEGGTLTISASTFSGNNARFHAGAIHNEGGTLTISASTFSGNSGGVASGAIYNEGGILTISASTFSGNSVIGNGGAIVNDGTTMITTSTFSNNTTGNGGAISNRGTLTITASTFSDNTANGDGGAIHNSSSGTFLITTTTFSGNSATRGGAIENFTGRAKVVDSAFSGNDAVVGGAISNSSSTNMLEIISSTFSDNIASPLGGAIYNFDGLAMVTASTFTSNEGFEGGAIYNERGTLMVIASSFSGNDTLTAGGAISNSGDLTITASTFSANNAHSNGGAISSSGDLTITASAFSGNSVVLDAGVGGKVFVTGGAVANHGTATVTASTFSSNSADFIGAGSEVVVYGGGIYNGGTLTITDSTFSSNTVTSVTEAYGGAIANLGTLTVMAGTVSGNSADSGRGAIFNDVGATATIASSIVANSLNAGNCAGAIISGGSNLSDDTSCGFTTTGDAQGDTTTISLGALADNGGPTQTMLPQSGSDALDTADCALSSAADQRGADRPDPPATTCDKGAVEVGGTVPVQIFAVYSTSGSIDEGGSATIHAIAYGPAGASLDYDFDCDNDGSYETQGSGTGNSSSATCTFPDDGDVIVGVRVCDASDTGNCATGSTTVTVHNVPPTITGIVNNGPVDEGSPATITVTASDPAGVNDPLTYRFDCDKSGDYETVGVGNQGQCTFDDNGNSIVGVQVDDGDGGTDTDSTTVTVNNVPPSVNAPTVDIEPSDEGQSVTASATFSDPGIGDTHTCTVDYDDGTGTQFGVVNQLTNTCTGPPHIYIDDDPNGTASDQYTVTVVVVDDDGDSDSNDTMHTVNNVPPVIEGITTDAPVPQGQPVTVTVDASDVGVNDELSYSFDCDDDGSYEIGPQLANSAQCLLDPAAATSTISVQVSDDDHGVTTGSVEVGQFVTLCRSNYTGSLSKPSAGGCPSGSTPLVLPGATPTAICVNPYTSAMNWSPGGSCSPLILTHVVPDDGPLAYCRNRWTGVLKANLRGAACGPYEQPGVIPG